MNRALLKQDAKDAMRAANPHPVLTTLAFLAITLAGTFVLNIIGGIVGFAGAVTGSDRVSFTGALFYLVVAVIYALVIGAVQFGYYAYCLKVFKHEDVGVGELFGYFPLLLKVFGLSLWIGLFVYLWSLLCVIPGIIAALRYSQALFILAEDPDKGIRQCVNESKELMSGRLWEFFVLQLSFILWYLLAGITCGLAALYVQPYATITFAGYYLSLKPQDTYAGGYAQDPGYQEYQQDNSYPNS